MSNNVPVVSSYNDENMLIGANKLNNDVKNYFEYLHREGLSHDTEDILHDLKLDIEEYLRDIEPYDFAPRNDRLTKEGILVDLHINLDRINAFPSEFNSRSGGKRKKRKTTRKKTNKRTNKKNKSRKR
jgi:hypothetical protein